MTTPSSSLKRSASISDLNPSEKKKPRMNETPHIASRALVDVSRDADYERATRNVVYLSSQTYRTLFQSTVEGQRLKVSNLVLQSLIDPALKKDRMDVNFMVHDQIKDGIIKTHQTHSIWISPYQEDVDLTAPVQTIHFRVSTSGQLNVQGKFNQPQALLTSSLESQIKESLVNQVFSLKQEIFFKHPVLGPLELKVEHWTLDTEGLDDAQFKKGPSYGTFTLATKISFSSGNTRSLTLVDEVDPKEVETFHFTITKVEAIAGKVFSSVQPASRDAWKDGVTPLPLIVPFSSLDADLRNRLTNRRLLLGMTEIFTKGSDWKYTVELNKVKAQVSDDESMDIDEEVEENQKAFRLTGAHRIEITTHSQVLLTQDQRKTQTAREMTFEIVDVKNQYELEENECAWVSVQEVSEQTIKTQKNMVVGGHIVIECQSRKLLLLLKKASGQNNKARSSLKTLWKADSSTTINVYSKDSLSLEIVDKPNPMPLASLIVKVSTKGGSSGGGALALLMGGDDKEDDKTIVTEEELRKIFKDALPSDAILHDKQSLSAMTGKGEKIEFKIDRLNPSGKKEYHGFVYRYLPDTTVKFEGEKGGGLLITSKPQEINFENIHEKLIEFGIGGMSEQFKDVISRTILSRGTYADHIRHLGQKPSRGMLLYGPPGTGKTLLARKIGEILGVSNERIKLYTGSQVWSKWLGDSEKKVREMFADARADQKRYGKESPLHLLILDEIDAFLKDRSTAERRYETSVVNTFIAELDGISSEGEDSLDNIIVIGLTNHLDGIDEAAKRPGRLSPHINIGIPDAKGREEIFNIHTRTMQKEGLLAKDVDTTKIVQMTIGKTGAFIEGLVVAAAEYSLKRLWIDKIAPDKINEHPSAKITMVDLINAYDECAKVKNRAKALSFSPSTDINLNTVSSDLHKLGLGGIPEEVIRFLSDLKLAQDYKNHLYTMKSPFPRGALLYGLPGAGKTRLSKAIRQLFRLDGQRFQYFQASELWPLAGGKLKDKIELMMQPAINAAKDLKGEAPLHVIVVDEIDMIYPHKKQTDNDVQSVMNQFLLEIDALFDDELHPLHNLLVLGIAHRPFYGLPEGILRHGRMGKHVEMKYPSIKGRKEIFEIYLKEYIDQGKIEGSLNWKELTEMTKDRSGAYIEGLVSEAAVNSLRRISQKGETTPKLSMQDFREAHDAIKFIEPWKGYIV